MKTEADFKLQLKRYQTRVDKSLRRFLQKPRSVPPQIHEAMVYSVFAGGKRLRPMLCLMAAEACGAKIPNAAMPTACALELIHTYSLIHDDLPALDNDDFRRGRPTSHKAFGEAMAILAGDALLTRAFELISRNAEIRGVKPDRVVRVIETIAKAAGTDGMIGGQVLDLQMEGARSANGHGPKALRYIHTHKTAALIQASLAAGAILSDATEAQIRALEKYGRCIGLAFQIADDVLDIVGDKKLLGKRGSDRDNKKLTYPSIYGLEASRQKAREQIEEAKRAVSIFGSRAALFRDLADFIIERDK